jgi:ribonucleoside-diphosphate reductase alpha chain
MARKEFIHASPTLFNAGTPKNQMLSCFLGGLHDSVDGIFQGLHRCAQISKFAGGIGLNVHRIRPKGSHIAGINGTADGLVPLARVFNETARYINQASKRNGSIAMYIQPDHPDILAFLDLKRNSGHDDERARYLFYGMWIPDLFMRRVQDDAIWSLFDPARFPELSELYGSAYDERYQELEAQGAFVSQVPAREIWKSILISQIETGTPYLLYKDAVNKKNNQCNLGTIQNSNLCAEIVEFSSDTEYACCTLASLGLPAFVETIEATNEMRVNIERLMQAVRQVVRNLDRVIELNYYPIPEARKSNMRHRPIGIGMQGLADVFAMLKWSFSSHQARKLNREIMESMYFAALSESVELAKQNGIYETFAGSPLSEGRFQCDLWGVKPSTSHDWEELRRQVVAHGVRHSLLIALMPTASTSQILGYNECFEPFTSNMYTRRTMAGEFVVVNKYLLRELMDLNLWTPEIKRQIELKRGSIAEIEAIPVEVRHRFRTVWEISQKDLIDMSAERAPFVCQTQSLNLFMSDPKLPNLSAMHVYAWKKGLKTGCYYLRTRPVAHMQQFTVEPVAQESKNAKANSTVSVSLDAEEKSDECVSCTA